MSDICPLCKGAGKQVVITPHKLSKIPRTTIEWCLCTKSKFVSSSPENRILSSLGDTYVDFDKIDPKLVFIPDDLSKSPNILIQGNFDTFKLHVKSTIMKYRFQDPAPFIYCCYAIDLLKNFYVEQPDKQPASLADTEKFDLLIFSLGTKEKNEQLKTVVAQVIYLRTCCKKPTWIYLPTPTFEACPQENSPELSTYTDKYEKVTLQATNNIKITLTKSKTDAASFSGMA